MNLLNGRSNVAILLLLAGLFAPAAATGESGVEPESPFRFEMTQGGNAFRGLAVEGYLYNGLSWRITNVRVRVESVDSTRTVIGESDGWVLGDVTAGGRGYFYLPIPRPAASYRARVQSFDKVSRDAPQAP
ncbi:MAG TPA: hypothetical protein VGL09_00295 [Methylomirabilota bacterium]